MLNELRDEGIENIMIFVSDAHRYDFLPDEIKQMGVTFKMVAASTFTAPSFSSICTGLFPFRHRVISFRDTIPREMTTLFEIDGMNSTFTTENTWVNWDFTELTPIFRMLRRKDRKSLQEIETPFIYIEDEKGGHCPYGWDEDDIYEEWECQKFFKDYGGKPPKDLKGRYVKGIERSPIGDPSVIGNQHHQRIFVNRFQDLIDHPVLRLEHTPVGLPGFLSRSFVAIQRRVHGGENDMVSPIRRMRVHEEDIPFVFLHQT